MSGFATLAVDERGDVEIGGGDKRLYVKFSRRSRKHAFRSEQEGRPIYESVDYVTIQQPGERDQVVRPVNESDKLRFPNHWRAYLADKEQVPDGTPVQLLFPNEPHVVDLLRDLKVFTVEQLAELGEHGIDKLGMDGRKLVGRAQAAISKAENLKEVNRLTGELRNATDRLAVLEVANQKLLERIDALEEARAEPAPRRGRLKPQQMVPSEPEPPAAELVPE
jgi:hypothetical protein